RSDRRWRSLCLARPPHWSSRWVAAMPMDSSAQAIRSSRLLPELITLQLSRIGAWQRGHELQGAGILVRCNLRLHKILELFFQSVAGCMLRPGDDERFHNLPAITIGNSDDRAFLHRRMLKQHVLNLDPRNVISRADDQIIGSRLK